MRKLMILNMLLMILLWSCSEREQITVGDTVQPQLSSNVENQSVVLTQETGEEVFDVFEWTAAEFGFQSANPEYNFLMALKKDGFEAAINLGATFDLEQEVINSVLNQKLLTLGATPDEAITVVFKVVGGLEESLRAESNVVEVEVTPYEVVIDYPKLYLAGAHNSWKFNDKEVLYSVKSDDIYEGYIYMDNGSDWNGFKLSRQPNWDSADAIIGDPQESGTSGTLQIGNWGGNNMFATEGTGVYYIKANLVNATYTIYKTAWAMTGDFNSWGFTDMTYDIDNNVWTLTQDFTAGGFKFIANGDWNKIYGDDELDGVLNKGHNENNIPIAANGNYTVVMDLSGPLYTYTITQN